jgi:Ni/Co efflux regulator RcnB
MKKSTLFTAAAVLALAAPLAISTASAQQGPSRNGQYQGPSQQAQNQDARDNDRRDHRDRRESWRDTRDDARWDDQQHNGYYMNGRWTYGQPSADRYGRRGFELGYRPWAVGQNLGYYNGRYQEVDYRRAQLRRPARGLRWVQDDRGDYLLVNRSGRITQVVISGNEPRDRRQSWRDARNDARWDESRHNGYYRNNIWTYGPPPEGRYARGEVVYGYQPCARRRAATIGFAMTAATICSLRSQAA